MADKACSSSTKVRKRATNGLCTGGGGDRISNLPDEILDHILSCVPTKVAVRTSVLSKKWRHVWTSVPCISIEDHTIQRKNQKRFTNPKFKACFVDFVRRVLRLNKVSSLQKCKLVCTGKYRGCFNEWIGALTTRGGVEELFLQNLAGEFSDVPPRIQLPPCLFTCKKLVILKLQNLFVLNVPISASLPNLKILHLVKVHYYNNNSLKNLLAGCPVLEELEIETDYDDNPKTLHIESSSLKSFRLAVIIDDLNENHYLRIILDAENIERLDIQDYMTGNFMVSSLSLSSLVSAKLVLQRELYKGGDGDFCIELLSKMCNTKYLHLSDSTMECFEFTIMDNLPMFHNLTHLVVKIMDLSWSGLPYLIECSPNLITFEFMAVMFGHAHLDEVKFRTPKCLMLHLESIKIEGFCWSENEMEMVRYFLMNSTVLKKMVIYVERLTPQQSNLCKELFMLPKVSTVCELKIDSYDPSLKKLLPVSQSCQDVVSGKTERKTQNRAKSSN